jgi:hypothetical protein
MMLNLALFFEAFFSFLAFRLALRIVWQERSERASEAQKKHDRCMLEAIV